MNFVNFVIVLFAIGKFARFGEGHAQILNFGTMTRANRMSTFYPFYPIMLA
jgi:hypothetical protein